MTSFERRMENILKKSRVIENQEFSNDELLQIMQVGVRHGIAPRLAVTSLESRLNKGLELGPIPDYSSHDLEGMLKKCLSDPRIGEELLNAMDHAVNPLTPEAKQAKAGMRAGMSGGGSMLMKGKKISTKEKAARDAILDKALKLSLEKKISVRMVTLIEGRLNKGLPLSDEMIDALGMESSVLQKSQRNHNRTRLEDSPLWDLLDFEKGQGSKVESHSENEEDEEESLDMEYNPEDGENEEEEDEEEEEKSTKLRVPVMIKGKKRNVPVHEVKRRLMKAVLRGPFGWPVGQIEGLLNQAEKGSSAAVQRLRKSYSTYIDGMFEE